MAKHLDLEEQEQLDQLKHFWNTWGTLISVVLIVLAGSLAAWNGYKYWQGRQASQAAALFEAVDLASRSGDRDRMKQAFNDLKNNYSSTVHAAHAGLMLAKVSAEAGDSQAARDPLTWVAGHAGDAGLMALAKIRLAGVLMEDKLYDEALTALSGDVPAEFSALVADRKGDILVLQDKRSQAIVEYKKAYEALTESAEFRRVVEIKLGALGFSPEGVAVASTAGAR